MKTITNLELHKIFKSRLSSQRRIFNFDEKQILVLPHLEHSNIEESIGKIKFYIDEKGNYIRLKQINSISFNNKKITILSKNKDEYTLFHKRMDGKFEKVRLQEFDMKNLTINHSPSIQVVLFTNYLNSSSAFETLSEFTKNLGSKFTTKEIKAAGFKSKTKSYLQNLREAEQEEITLAYKIIFNEMILEIALAKNNNANSSLESLDYYKNNKGNFLN